MIEAFDGLGRSATVSEQRWEQPPHDAFNPPRLIQVADVTITQAFSGEWLWTVRVAGAAHSREQVESDASRFVAALRDR